eukprot:m.232409 g.232409  ORF g.232409 m.232409 type:complete len:81 (+) comp17373_c0_seq16:515-757(+)
MNPIPERRLLSQRSGLVRASLATIVFKLEKQGAAQCAAVLARAEDAAISPVLRTYVNNGSKQQDRKAGTIKRRFNLLTRG